MEHLPGVYKALDSISALRQGEKISPYTLLVRSHLTRVQQLPRSANHLLTKHLCSFRSHTQSFRNTNISLSGRGIHPVSSQPYGQGCWGTFWITLRPNEPTQKRQALKWPLSSSFTQFYGSRIILYEKLGANKSFLGVGWGDVCKLHRLGGGGGSAFQNWTLMAFSENSLFWIYYT